MFDVELRGAIFREAPDHRLEGPLLPPRADFGDGGGRVADRVRRDRRRRRRRRRRSPLFRV